MSETEAPTILDSLDQIAAYAHQAGAERVDLHLGDVAIAEMRAKCDYFQHIAEYGKPPEERCLGVFRERLYIYRASTISPFEAADRLASMLRKALPDASVRRLPADDGGCSEAVVVEIADKTTGQSVRRITTITTLAHARAVEALGMSGHTVVEPRSWTHGAVREECDRILESLGFAQARSGP